jgi:hypothetical protein
LPRRLGEALSSSNTTSAVQLGPFSIPQCRRTSVSIRCGESCPLGMEVRNSRVSTFGNPPSLVRCWRTHTRCRASGKSSSGGMSTTRGSRSTHSPLARSRTRTFTGAAASATHALSCSRWKFSLSAIR